jgi:hypothetical protein
MLFAVGQAILPAEASFARPRAGPGGTCADPEGLPPRKCGQSLHHTSRTTRNPMFPVALSGVFAVRAAFRYRKQNDAWQRYDPPFMTRVFPDGDRVRAVAVRCEAVHRCRSFRSRPPRGSRKGNSVGIRYCYLQWRRKRLGRRRTLAVARGLSQAYGNLPVLRHRNLLARIWKLKPCDTSAVTAGSPGSTAQSRCAGNPRYIHCPERRPPHAWDCSGPIQPAWSLAAWPDSIRDINIALSIDRHRQREI